MRVLALTSLSWLLPVELSPDGLERVAIHYDKAIPPAGDWQCYGIEDLRISRGWRRLADDELLGQSRMPVDHVLQVRQRPRLALRRHRARPPEQGHADLRRADRRPLWAQTRPLGDNYFAYPPGSEWRGGPSINLATSPDALHWKPYRQPGIRPRAGAGVSRIGGGAPPILTDRGWLALWHGVEPRGEVGVYRTNWSLLDRTEPSRVLDEGRGPMIEANPALTAPLAKQMYLSDVVFTTGIVDASDSDGGDHYIVASGEADLACRITHVPKAHFA